MQYAIFAALGGLKGEPLLTIVNSLPDMISHLSMKEDDRSVAGLCAMLSLWIEDDDDVLMLRENIEHYIEGTWPGQQDGRAFVEPLWIEFCESQIKLIQGMTMNERLFAFGLLDRFDRSQSDEKAVLTVYSKVLATP